MPECNRHHTKTPATQTNKNVCNGGSDQLGVLWKEGLSLGDFLKDDLNRERIMARQYLYIAGVMLLLLDRDGNVRLVNRKGSEILGFSESEIIGKNWFDVFVPTKHRESFKSLYPLMMAGDIKLPDHLQNPVITCSGEERIISWENCLIHNSFGDITGCLCSGMDITGETKVKEQLRWELQVNYALSSLYKPLTAPRASLEDITATVLAQAQNITGSRHGLVSSIDLDTGDNIGHTFTAMHGQDCRMTYGDKIIVLPRSQDGIYGLLCGVVLNTGKPFFTNNPDSHPASRGVPAGHIPILRFLAVPVILGTQIIGMIALANKDSDYTQRDLDAVNRLSEYYALALQRKRGDEAIQLSYLEMEKRVEARTAQLSSLTEKLRAEIQLHTRSEKKYSSLVENSITGIGISQNDTIVFATHRLATIFGCSPKKLTGLAFTALFHSDELPTLRAALDDIQARGGSFEKEVPGFTKDRRQIWLDIRLGLIEFNEKPAVICNILDITSRKELEHLVRVQDKMTSLGRIATGIAHELRNPLSGINIHLSNLERVFAGIDGLPDETRATMERITGSIKSASKKIETVVKRVYDYSRPNMHNLAQVDVNHLIREIIQISAVTFRQKKVTVEEKLSSCAIICKANQGLFEQLLLNLITNAVQVLEQQPTDRRILITSSLAQNMVMIRIADSGSGIPEYLKHKIFDPFFTMKQDGLGIGLSICYRIVKDHGGSLSVDRSRELGGAEFTISIPVDVG